MRRVFISCPMRGRTNENINFTIAEIKKELTRLCPMEDFIFCDNFKTYEVPESANKSVYCLGQAISKMASADIVVTLRPTYSWFNGCDIERKVALLYGITIVDIGYEESLIKAYDVMPDLFDETGPKTLTTE